MKTGAKSASSSTADAEKNNEDGTGQAFDDLMSGPLVLAEDAEPSTGEKIAGQLAEIAQPAAKSAPAAAAVMATAAAADVAVAPSVANVAQVAAGDNVVARDIAGVIKEAVANAARSEAAPAAAEGAATIRVAAGQHPVEANPGGSTATAVPAQAKVAEAVLSGAPRGAVQAAVPVEAQEAAATQKLSEADSRPQTIAAPARPDIIKQSGAEIARPEQKLAMVQKAADGAETAVPRTDGKVAEAPQTAAVARPEPAAASARPAGEQAPQPAATSVLSSQAHTVLGNLGPSTAEKPPAVDVERVANSTTDVELDLATVKFARDTGGLAFSPTATEVQASTVAQTTPLTAVASAPATQTAAPIYPAAAHMPFGADPATPVSQQIATAFKLGADGARIELKLDPPELGRVRIDLEITERGVTAVVTADRSDTLDLMRRHADSLNKELTQAGYDDVDLDFRGSDQQRNEENSGDRAADGAWGEGEEARGVAASKPMARIAQGGADGLDLRI